MRGWNVTDGGTAWIWSSCEAANVTLGNGALLAGSTFINLENVQLAEGAVMILHSSQCHVTSVSVAGGASFYLSRNNYATSVSVESDGLFFVASGASALAVTSAAGAVISTENGAYIQYANNEGE